MKSWSCSIVKEEVVEEENEKEDEDKMKDTSVDDLDDCFGEGAVVGV